MKKQSGRVLVVGAGFLGQELIEQASALGWDVVGVKRSVPKKKKIGFSCVEADVANKASVEALAKKLAEADWSPDWVLHCASTGGGEAGDYRKVYQDGCAHLIEAFPQAKIGFTSSTSVYAQTGGKWVNESNVAAPKRETGQVLLDAEDLVRAQNGTVLRLAGLYGKERSVLIDRFLAGEAVIERGVSRWINQIHVTDAAAAWCAAMAAVPQQVQGHIFNVADGEPQTQRQIQEFLANWFNKEVPPEAEPDFHRKRGWTNKRIAVGKMKSLGWSPRYPSFCSALRQQAIQTKAK